jgi:hypothetical protein
MQPSKLKHLCVGLIMALFAFFAPSAVFAQAKKTAPSQSPARMQARQATHAAKKAATASTITDAVQTATQAEAKSTKIVSPPLETPHLEEGEDRTTATPTKAVKQN